MYANLWQKRVGSYLPGLKGNLWPPRLEGDPARAADLGNCPLADRGATTPDPDSLGVGEGAGHQPWQECFVIIKPQATPPGQRPPLANDSDPRPTPEQIAARRHELEELRQGLEREEAELDANTEPNFRL